MITQQQQIDAKEYRCRVKAQLALNDDAIAKLADRIGKRPNTVTLALREPWKFPIVIASINADLFGKQPAKRKASRSAKSTRNKLPQ
jgi:hypothetical protein